MTYIEFLHSKPKLQGIIRVNGKVKHGSFIPEWSMLSNSICYRYHTPAGHKGTGGFTAYKAWYLLEHNLLTIKQ